MDKPVSKDPDNKGFALVVTLSLAVYHVMVRGDGGKPVFEDDKDRHGWLDLMERAFGSFGWRVHAWVLTGKRLRSWRWSSFASYAGGKSPEWLFITASQRRSRI